MLEEIQNATPEEIEELLKAVLDRYEELYPDWEVFAMSTKKTEDRNIQLDQIITLLNKLKDKN